MSLPPSPPFFSLFDSPSPAPSPESFSDDQFADSPPPPVPISSSPPSPSTSNPPSTSPPPPLSPSGGVSSSPGSSSPTGLSTGVVVGITIGGLLAVLVVLALVFFMCKKKRQSDHEAPPPTQAGGSYRGQQQQNASRTSDHMVTSMPPSALPRPPAFIRSNSSCDSDSTYSDHPVLPPPSPRLGINQNTFTYEELSRATNGFSEANLLGQGGFGYVFKGTLSNGKDIAVKQLKAGSAQGEREFQAEVEIISRVHHKHLVTLVGYCIMGAQRLLVYEFVPNNTLDFHLHGKGRPPLEWSSRLKIAVGSAKALSYLHENCDPKIIHRDIKAANILIDFKFEAKVADFGLAKIVPDTNTHVSTRIMGSFGYLAPEYAASGKLSEKSDVYSFGVVLLELITGRRPFDSNNNFQDDNLVDWALPLLNQATEEGDFEVLADTKMNNEYDLEEMARMVACAAACVRHRARHRPSMDQVVRVLNGNVSPSELKEGIKPVKSWTDCDTSKDNENMKKNWKVALGSSSYNTSSEYSNPTSDFGMHSSGSSTGGDQTTREMEFDPSH